MTSVAIELPEVDDLVAKVHAEFRPHGLAAALDERPDVARRGVAVVDDEVAVRRRDACAADGGALEARAIDERARRLPLRILKNAAGARRVERLGALAVRERLAR